MADIENIGRVYAALAPVLDERSLRLWAAAQSQSLGHGGIGIVAKATGMARSTIADGLKQLRGCTPSPSRQRIRRAGGGRKRIEQTNQGVLCALEALVDPLTRGDPMSPLRWTCKSTSKLAAFPHASRPSDDRPDGGSLASGTGL